MPLITYTDIIGVVFKGVMMRRGSDVPVFDLASTQKREEIILYSINRKLFDFESQLKDDPNKKLKMPDLISESEVAKIVQQTGMGSVDDIMKVDIKGLQAMSYSQKPPSEEEGAPSDEEGYKHGIRNNAATEVLNVLTSRYSHLRAMALMEQLKTNLTRFQGILKRELDAVDQQFEGEDLAAADNKKKYDNEISEAYQRYNENLNEIEEQLTYWDSPEFRMSCEIQIIIENIITQMLVSKMEALAEVINRALAPFNHQSLGFAEQRANLEKLIESLPKNADFLKLKKGEQQDILQMLRIPLNKIPQDPQVLKVLHVIRKLREYLIDFRDEKAEKNTGNTGQGLGARFTRVRRSSKIEAVDKMLYDLDAYAKTLLDNPNEDYSNINESINQSIKIVLQNAHSPTLRGEVSGVMGLEATRQQAIIDFEASSSNRPVDAAPVALTESQKKAIDVILQLKLFLSNYEGDKHDAASSSSSSSASGLFLSVKHSVGSRLRSLSGTDPINKEAAIDELIERLDHISNRLTSGHLRGEDVLGEADLNRHKKQTFRSAIQLIDLVTEFSEDNRMKGSTLPEKLSEKLKELTKAYHKLSDQGPQG